MLVSWKVDNLGKFAIIKDGTHQTPTYVKYGIPFYSVENVTNDEFDNTKYISELEHQRLTAKYKIEKNDILMTRIGTIGKFKLVNWDVNASFYVSLALIKCSCKIDPKFLCYLSETRRFKESVYLNSLQYAIPMKINLNKISDIELYYPDDIKYQKKLSSMANNIDILLENLEKEKTKKEKMKSRVIYDLFNNCKIVDSKKVSTICTIKTGKLDANKASKYGDYRFYTCAKNYSLINEYAFEGPALLISGNGEYVGYIHYYDGKFNAYQRTYVLQNFDKYNIKYIKNYLDLYLKQRINMEKKDGNTPYIVYGTLADFVINFPEEAEQQKICKIINDFDKDIEHINEKIEKYRKIRGSMIEELFSGKKVIECE